MHDDQESVFAAMLADMPRDGMLVRLYARARAPPSKEEDEGVHSPRTWW